ncbi:xylulokinase [Glaciecola sp. KUL10]|uniref:xylulokinase n=1 Tax=Glaciecola sp. (strain KUL10) TaxID=2161813 RepID=UPI000D784C5A|nr:xylulokinase [Glaciecola sp. KUL10]GBL04292.1 xylulokinase [Glaciecola sp. KUL10]
MYLGIDLGTSGIKVIITDQDGKLVASVTEGLTVQRKHALWSEQDPAQWWDALQACMSNKQLTPFLGSVKALGVTGQMHGSVALDKDANVLRPAILWNDGRSSKECAELEAEVKNARQITGNLIMPGFTAPKIKWMQKHEPELFQKIDKVLLPKDYLRYLLSGDFASDMSDSAGSLWLDVENRKWNTELLKACGLDESHMPTLYEGSDITGHLSPSLAQKWGMQSVPIIAGGGDNAAGAVGVGLINSGKAMISLGTSGVYFVVNNTFSANPDKAVHSFCHALPNTWHLMSVILSAASCLEWLSTQVLKKDLGELMLALEQADLDTSKAPIFLPYLSGERTPHNNPNAVGNFFGITHQTSDLDMLYAVMEGVCFAFADGFDVLHENSPKPDAITLIGGGSKSLMWRQMFADILNIEIDYREGGDVGPALGAARLAQIAVDDSKTLVEICPEPPVVATYQPNQAAQTLYKKRRATFIQLYSALKTLY